MLGPIITSFGLDVSIVIVNVSLSSTIMSSVTFTSRHTELLIAVVKGITRTSFAKGLKSLAPETVKRLYWIKHSHNNILSL